MPYIATYPLKYRKKEKKNKKKKGEILSFCRSRLTLPSRRAKLGFFPRVSNQHRQILTFVVPPLVSSATTHPHIPDETERHKTKKNTIRENDTKRRKEGKLKKGSILSVSFLSLLIHSI